MIPKHNYIRSKKLLKLAAGLDCQQCGSATMVQAAHSNWGGGKGRGIKCDDNLIAALCQSCHYEIDQGKNLTKAERQSIWQAAHEKTVSLLLDRGEWPADVPVPNIFSC
jgi:transcription elongation factor Elf1